MKPTSVLNYIKENKEIHKYIDENNYSDIRFSNFGFIVILDKIVLKHYVGGDFLKLNGINKDATNYYYRENKNYEIVKKETNILMPNYKYIKDINIGFEIKIAEMENIRKGNDKIKLFSEININQLIELIKKIHNIEKKGEKCFIHGNIHPTNFFIKKGDLGIFDFASGRVDYPEIDIARILNYINNDIEMAKYIINRFKYIDIKRLKYYYLEHFNENFQNQKTKENYNNFKMFYSSLF